MTKLMCHVVAGYPKPGDCLRLMIGMQAIGVAAIEVQIPFSDPIADGETIMLANDVALNGGMTTATSFDLIAKARKQGLTTDLYIMSYLQKVAHFGVEEFCRQAQERRVSGLIIPDLPYDSPEFSELSRQAANYQLQLVPVLSPGMHPSRLSQILKLKPAAIYVTSSPGITGKDYLPAAQLKNLIKQIKQQSDAQIIVGFGIGSRQDVKDVLAFADTAVVGSAIIRKLQTAGLKPALKLVESLAETA